MNTKSTDMFHAAEDGINIFHLPAGTTILVQTRNTRYTLRLKGLAQITIEGGYRFPKESPIHYIGATWGGSMIKPNWLAVDMCMELRRPGVSGVLTTSRVENYRIITPENGDA